MFFKKKPAARTFDDVLRGLGDLKFDVAPAATGAGKRVSKYGCAAEIAPAEGNATQLLSKSGVLVGGQIARILDRGYQKFLVTPKLQIVATADHLRALHQFQGEFDEMVGGVLLYNESLGSTSDTYDYDRVKGREHHS